MAEELGVDRVGTRQTPDVQNEQRNDLAATERREVQDAASAEATRSVQQQALQVTNGETSGDGYNPANGGVQALGNGARQYGHIDPTNGRGINGTQMTPKVQAQLGRDAYHGFPRGVDTLGQEARSFAFRGGDGQIRAGVEAPGTLNGKGGNYQWMVEPNGRDVNHRLFVADGNKNTIPRSSIINGTNAARVAGRVLLPVAAGMDLAAIATSNDVPRTATEKAGAWTGSLALGGLAAKAAAPMLAAGPVGWVGYGVTVIGAGALGYFGGEQLAGRAYSWLSGS
jgi:hypothetical protein